MDIEFNADLCYAADSIICRFDARAKIIFLFSALIVIFSIKAWANIYIFFLFYAFIIFLNKIPLEKIFNGIRTWFLVVIFLCAFPFFATKGRQFIHIGWINITYEGVRESGMLFAKLVLASLGAKILTATTTIKQVILAFQYFFSSFKILGFSSDEIGFVISIGAGFIRFFTKEVRRIIQIGTLRGIDRHPDNIFRQPSTLLFLVQAIITRMYITGFQIEESFHLYGYSQYAVKTSFYELKWKLMDWIPIVCIVFLGIAVSYFNQRF